VLNVLTFLVEVVEQYTIWVYIICGAIIVWNLRRYLLAHSDRRNTIFPVEREVAAHREGQAMSVIGAMLAICVVAVAVRHFVLPSVNVAELVQPTPTMTLMIPTREPTATAVVEETPVATATPRPTPTHQPTLAVAAVTAPTNTPPPPEPSCADPNTCISAPRSGETVSGAINIRGNANHPQFQFYKVEFGIGSSPEAWSSIGDIVRRPVSEGALMTFNTAAVPNGTYTIRLVVVDITGNYPPPYTVTVNVQN
jgi:hypothetical protein